MLLRLSRLKAPLTAVPERVASTANVTTADSGDSVTAAVVITLVQCYHRSDMYRRVQPHVEVVSGVPSPKRDFLTFESQLSLLPACVHNCALTAAHTTGSPTPLLILPVVGQSWRRLL
jgi:hypothetical protein